MGPDREEAHRLYLRHHLRSQPTTSTASSEGAVASDAVRTRWARRQGSSGDELDLRRGDSGTARRDGVGTPPSPPRSARLTAHSGGAGRGSPDGRGSRAGIGSDSIFCGPLGRARTTGDIIGRRLELPVTEVKDLAEVRHGSVAGLTNAEIEIRHPGLAERGRLDKYGFRFPDGELRRRRWASSTRVGDDREHRSTTTADRLARDDRADADSQPARSLARGSPGLEPPAQHRHPFELPKGRVSGLDVSGAQLQFSGKVWELFEEAPR